MKEYEVIIGESTYEMLKAVAGAENNPSALAAAADIDPQKFLTFLREIGKSEDTEALQLLSAAKSRRAAIDAFQKTAAKLSPGRIKIRVRRQSVDSMTRELSRQLGELIESGALAAGTLLPSERQLANSLGVARSVVRGSYEYLEKAGVVNSESTKSRKKPRKKVASKKKSPAKQQPSSARRKAKVKSFKGGAKSTQKRSKAKSSGPTKASLRKKLTA